jgi:nitrous-oxide reductase
MNHSWHGKTASMAIIAIIAVTLVLSGVVVPIPIPPQQAAAQQQNNATTTTRASPSLMPSSSNKIFYVFSAEVEGVNETAAKVPADTFSLPMIEVNKGDKVTVHFYNTEEKDAQERHSFTIDAQPYSVNIDTAPGESGNATFTADQEGIFPYYCKYHLPTMTGELIVLPSRSSQSAASPQPAT